MNENNIRSMLIALGISPHLKGYHFLVEGIKLYMETLNTEEDIKWTVLYAEVAKQFHSTYSRVERAMRHAIATGFDTPNALLHKVFDSLVSYYSGKVYVSTFIATVAEFIRIKGAEVEEELSCLTN